MFYCVSRVASNYGVLDTDDGVIEWLDEGTLRSYLQQGVEIVGYTLQYGYTRITPPVLDWNLCNWADKRNIFQHGVVRNRRANGEMEIVYGKKRFKCRVTPEQQGVKVLFSFNVQTLLPADVFQMLLHNG